MRLRRIARPGLIISILALAPVPAWATVGQTCPVRTDWMATAVHEGASIVVPGRIGSSSVAVVFDTGMPVSTVDIAIADANGLRASGGQQQQRTVGGNYAYTGVKPFTLTIGGRDLPIRDGHASALPDFARTTGRPVVIVGRDVLDQCVLDVDADRERVRIGDRRPWLTAPERVPIDRFGVPRAPVVPIRLGQGGPARPAEAIVVLDTGSQAGLSLDRWIWDRIDHRATRETSVVTMGLGGLAVEGIAILDAIAIGGVRVGNVETRIVTGPAGKAELGTLGMGVLVRFNASIDLAGGSLLLAPRRTALPPIVKSTSGVLAIVQGDRLRIVHVMRGSPAAAVGLTDRDAICAVDERPIPPDYDRSPLAVWSRDTPGRSVSLRLCDGRTVTLVLKDFY